MATTWKTIAVRVERPAEASLADFFADMRSWLDHRCIMPAEFRGVTLATKSGVFDVLFDNPRDAQLFGQRFAAQPTSIVTSKASDRWTRAAASAIDQSRASIRTALAADIRNLLTTRTKTYQSA